SDRQQRHLRTHYQRGQRARDPTCVENGLVMESMLTSHKLTRRAFLVSATAALAQTAKPTNFQIACMTLPYSPFPMQRAVEGIARAGYHFVAWGTTHMEAPGDRRPALALDAPPADAKQLAARCRGMGLEPIMMFSTVQLEEPTAGEAHLRRIDQAAAA